MRAAACAALLLLSGCASLPEPAAPGDWDARRAELQALDTWTLSGRAAVAAGDDGFSGGLLWQQRGAAAEVSLHGPMGSQAMRIHVDGDRYSVDAPGGANHAGEGAEQFLQERFGPGQPLPVREMRYWLVGAPAPGAPHEESLGADRRLASLSQSGWKVRYDRYESVGTLELPARLEMTTEGLRLRIVVSDWRVAP